MMMGKARVKVWITVGRWGERKRFKNHKNTGLRGKSRFTALNNVLFIVFM